MINSLCLCELASQIYIVIRCLVFQAKISVQYERRIGECLNKQEERIMIFVRWFREVRIGLWLNWDLHGSISKAIKRKLTTFYNNLDCVRT